MITMLDILTEDARRQDLIRQADLYRLAKQVPTHHLTLPISFRPLLIRLGESLVTWGRRLQAQEAVECSSSPNMDQNV